MLSSVHIENFALIKNIDISFGGGFCVLTGETGAGKSIIIDAVSLLCGARADRAFIRSGEDSAFVEGLFCGLGEGTLASLAELEIFPDEDGLVSVSRRLYSDGRTTARICGRQVPVSRLREVAPLLITIHGQQDTQSLAEEKKQLAMIDGYAGSARILVEYGAEYGGYVRLLEKIRELEKTESEKEFILELTEHKIKEIEAVNPLPGEEEKLTAERNMLANSERIISRANEAFSALYRSQNSAFERVSEAAESLGDLTGIIPECAELLDRAENAKYEIEDIADRLRPFMSADGDNPAAKLDKIEERLTGINSLKRRFKTDFAGLLAEYEKLKKSLDEMESGAVLIAEYTEKADKRKKAAQTLADRLSALRKEAAAALSDKVKQTLLFLDMPAVRFITDFSPKPLSPDGADSVALLISANAGEEPKPLAKVASGGELSRVMLALKSIPSGGDDPVMIFDEIDTGISGKTSAKIGIKLSETARESGVQVICVTHSAQIAAKADEHLLIQKSESEGRTSVSARLLQGERRVEEIARIIGGVTVTDTVRQTARELIAGA